MGCSQAGTLVFGSRCEHSTLRRWQLTNLSILSCGWRSRSGLMSTPRSGLDILREHGISRKSFYELRKRARADGPSAVLEPRTRRPKSSPSALNDEVKAQAVAVRAALEASGLDHGPISVHDKMQSMGVDSGALNGLAGPDLPRSRCRSP